MVTSSSVWRNRRLNCNQLVASDWRRVLTALARYTVRQPAGLLCHLPIPLFITRSQQQLAQQYEQYGPQLAAPLVCCCARASFACTASATTS